MNHYYKVIADNSVAGVCTEFDFRRYQAKHNIIIVSDCDRVECVQIGDRYYHDEWMAPCQCPHIDALVVAITEEEYNTIAAAIEGGQEIPEPQVDETTEQGTETSVDPIEGLTLDFVKSRKLEEMRQTCSKAIESGIDVRMDDGSTQHFALTLTDQMMINSLAAKAQQGTELLPWHADGEPSRFYTAVEMIRICDSMERFVTYHQAYFNSLKIYINSISEIETVGSVTYGMEIPAEYQSEVMQSILAGGYETGGDGENVTIADFFNILLGRYE